MAVTELRPCSLIYRADCYHCEKRGSPYSSVISRNESLDKYVPRLLSWDPAPPVSCAETANLHRTDESVNGDSFLALRRPA
jgi:hypothetical protein